MAEPALPTEWHGTWTGTLKIAGTKGDPQETPMEMVIEQMKEAKSWRWKIVYGDGKKQSVRDYELVPQDDNAKHFVIDEKNGLQIDAWLIGNTMHSQFQVADSMIPVRYERRGDALIFSLVVYSNLRPRVTKLTGGDMEAKAFRVESVHTAELRKKAK